MRVGTKSVLFGAHCFFLHPWFVARAWWKLFGFPWDPRLWVAFFVHDLGYWGKPNMDGKEGEAHVEWGAGVMGRLFDGRPKNEGRPIDGRPQDLSGWSVLSSGRWVEKWGNFCLLHSRFYAKQLGRPVSRLCFADKLAVVLEPWWFYLPRAILSGEVQEYMALAAAPNPASKYAGETTKYESIGLDLSSRRAWFCGMTEYMREWVAEHIDVENSGSSGEFVGESVGANPPASCGGFAPASR